jgi:hypothetical protein
MLKEECITNLFRQNVTWTVQKTYNYSIHILQEVHLVSHKQHGLILEYAFQTFLHTKPSYRVQLKNLNQTLTTILLA